MASLEMALTADREASLRRRAELSGHLAVEVDDGIRLICSSGDACRRSAGPLGVAAGQLSHVGDCYELREGGRPLRILVVPKQTGRGHEHVTVAERVAQVDSAKPLSARPMPRTAHMDGTALALKVLLGLPAAGSDELALDGRRVHVFDCFAMANATLCTRLTGSATGAGTPVMYRNCLRHLAETIRILEPTVIVAQGWSQVGDSPSLSVAEVLGIPKPPRGSCTRITTPFGEVAFAAVVHPSRNWAVPQAPKFAAEVVPALHAARAA